MEQNTKQDQIYKEKIVRIMSKDVEGWSKLYPGLTKIKGVSWAMSNLICKKLGLDKSRRTGSLSEAEVKKIEEFMKKPQAPKYMLNRRQDFETGEDKHIVSSTLELQKEFDIKRLKKIKSYRGFRHMAGLPMRGQKTKAHFRKNKQKGVGIKKKGSKKQ